MSVAVEVLTIAGCPNADAAVRLVEEVGRDLGVDVALRRVEVADTEAAVAHRFIGSPTVRVAGVDIEPSAEARGEFVVACRLYRTAAGPSGIPSREWLEAALLRAGGPQSN